MFGTLTQTGTPTPCITSPHGRDKTVGYAPNRLHRGYVANLRKGYLATTQPMTPPRRGLRRYVRTIHNAHTPTIVYHTKSKIINIFVKMKIDVSQVTLK